MLTIASPIALLLIGIKVRKTVYLSNRSKGKGWTSVGVGSGVTPGLAGEAFDDPEHTHHPHLVTEMLIDLLFQLQLPTAYQDDKKLLICSDR